MARPSQAAPVTQDDVAKSLGLSRSTVSLALRNSPKIPHARRQQIQLAAEQMGYRVNSMATALSHHRRVSKVSPRGDACGGKVWLSPGGIHPRREDAGSPV